MISTAFVKRRCVVKVRGYRCLYGFTINCLYGFEGTWILSALIRKVPSRLVIGMCLTEKFLFELFLINTYTMSTAKGDGSSPFFYLN